MRKLFAILESCFTVLALIFYTGGPLVVILAGGRSEGEVGSTDYRLVRQCFQLIYCLTFLLVIPHWRKALYFLSKDKMIAILIGLILLSIFWSTAPQQTLNRSIAIIGTTLFGIYLTMRYSLKQQLQLLGWTFCLIILLSVCFVVALPQYGVMSAIHAGAWRGIYLHKNVFGNMMALSSIVFLLLSIGARNNVFYWGGLGISIFLLAMSRSASPVVNLLVLTAIFISSRATRLRYKSRAFVINALFALSLVFAVSVMTNAETLLGNFGKDLTLTGRTQLWSHAGDLIAERPWLGYGYGALWFDWSNETATVWRAVGWEPPNAHNGFLDLWLGLGLLGISVFAVHFLINLFRSSVKFIRNNLYEYNLPFLLFILTLLVNFTESSLIDRNSIYWVLYVSFTLSLYKQHRYTSQINELQSFQQ